MANETLTLSQLRAKREAKQAERAALTQAQLDALEVDKLQRVIALEEKGEVEGRDFACIDTSLGVVIVQRPQAMVYRKFADLDKPTTFACLELARASLVHPSKEEYNAWMDRAPGAITRVASAIVALCEAGAPAEAKK